jgi:hypothetical protein
MLMRILTDNPGQPFTKFFNDSFVSTIKRLLRDGRDPNVQQIVRETLDYFEAEKAQQQQGLHVLMAMWRKEKSKGARFPTQPVVRTSDVFVPYDADDSSQYPNGMPMAQGGHGGHGGQRTHRSSRHQLPPPAELAARIEEAKTTARLLIQTVQSTPQAELLANELVKEFAERARSAHKSIQNYMGCESPAPDEDTMLTLIETNDQLNVAMSKHQRALLQARKAAGLASPTPPGQNPEANNYMQAHTPGQNVYQNVYNQPPQQPPRQAVSPISNPESFTPPSGPPPQQSPGNTFTAPPGPPPTQARGPAPQQNTYEYEDAYAPAPHIPAMQPTGPGHNHTRSGDYGVSENPFSDAHANDDDGPQPPPKQQNSSALFGRGQPVTTQSYLQRQESSANNITMHGGSPPPGGK